MRNIIEIECPPELLIGLHTNAEQFAERVKREAAYGLFREGAISSGVAASWLGVSRTHFLIDAMRHGAKLLDDSDDDFRRETDIHSEHHQ
jgi:hypothetical protein